MAASPSTPPTLAPAPPVHPTAPAPAAEASEAVSGTKVPQSQTFQFQLHDDYKQRFLKLQDDNKALQKEFQESSDSKDSTIADLNDKIKSLEKVIKLLQKDIKDKETGISDTKTELDRTANRAGKLMEENTALKQTVKVYKDR